MTNPIQPNPAQPKPAQKPAQGKPNSPKPGVQPPQSPSSRPQDEPHRGPVPQAQGAPSTDKTKSGTSVTKSPPASGTGSSRSV